MRVLADGRQVARLVDELAERVAAAVAQHPGDTWGVVGVRSRGDVLARRLAERLDADAIGGRIGTLDITLYRDDLSEVASQPVVRPTDIPFPVDGLHLVLVDDVLMTGRSIRAAIQQLIDLGRPRRVWLAVLVDRGGRELPIAADFAALSLTGAQPEIEADESVHVQLRPTDPQDAIVVGPRAGGAA